MIRHIVMFKLKENAEGYSKAENLERVYNALMACKNLPGITHFEVIIAGDKLEASMDVLLDSTFIDKEALDAYQIAPIHEVAKELIGKVREERVVFDYVK
ncbi:Dabb family protein [Thorsellia kenyensis]|uniref:Dabb family protein n=1 Tax=Thorsellia kenyensis TaxID=1549888 RepID=A0ABV6C9P1_9GAMM